MRYLFLIIFSLSAFFSFSQVNTFGGGEELEPEYCFAIRIMPNTNNQLFQCVIIKKYADIKGNVSFLTLNDWVLQAAGFENSPANPYHKNYFKKYNVFDIPQSAIDLGEKEQRYYTINKSKAIFQNLWRLKYSEYPYYSPKMNNEKGWASHPDPQITWLPSENQLDVLRTSFGIRELNEFIQDENAFKLLRLIRDRNWQNMYIQSAGGN